MWRIKHKVSNKKKFMSTPGRNAEAGSHLRKFCLTDTDINSRRVNKTKTDHQRVAAVNGKAGVGGDALPKFPSALCAGIGMLLLNMDSENWEIKQHWEIGKRGGAGGEK